jgi:hypothetical protein
VKSEKSDLLVLAESDTLTTGLLPLCRIGGPKAVGSMGVRRSFRIDGNAMRERNDASSFRSMKIVSVAKRSAKTHLST